MSDGGDTNDRQTFRKGRQVHKVVFCTGYGGHLQNKPLLTRELKNTSASQIMNLEHGQGK